MKIVQIIVSALLGALFVFGGLFYFFGEMPPPPPTDTPAGMFFSAFSTTGYFDFIKVLEIAGGLLVAIPRTRVIGLLILTPIIVNIVAFHAFITNGVGLGLPLGILLAAVFLIWGHRKGVAALLTDRA
jgi:putative oxidoreductase